MRKLSLNFFVKIKTFINKLCRVKFRCIMDKHKELIRKSKNFFTKNKTKEDTRINKLKKTWYGRVFYFIWYDDSVISWIVNIILAFIIIKFIFYPLLGLIFATQLPVVAVISCSMEHRYTNCGEPRALTNMCGIPGDGNVDFDTFWDNCGNFYEAKGITKTQFSEYPMDSGFNKGDIIFLKGIDDGKINIGDIIVFNAEKRAYPIIHRVIANNLINGEYIIQTKGDHNKAQINDGFLDETNIPESQIIGKAILKVPFLGYIKIWFTDLINVFR